MQDDNASNEKWLSSSAMVLIRVLERVKQHFNVKTKTNKIRLEKSYCTMHIQLKDNG